MKFKRQIDITLDNNLKIKYLDEFRQDFYFNSKYLKKDKALSETDRNQFEDVKN